MKTSPANQRLIHRVRRLPACAILFAAGWACLALPPLACAQPAAGDADAGQVDEVGREAAKLEAELGKFKDTSPEAADALVKLVELYHQHARAFGLIRAGQKFSSSHPADPRHHDVMLKLIDGLEAMSRSRDLTVACRQFLQKYPQSPLRRDVAQRLAATLDKLNERVDAAKVLQRLWEEQPNAAGRDFGTEAVVRFSASSRREDITAAAEIAEQMCEKLPANEYIEAIGLKGVEQWERIGQWSNANALANKLVAKDLPKDPEQRRALLRRVAENYARQSQFANAVESLKKTRAIRDDQEPHYQQIQRMYNAAIKATELQPVVDDYFKKYPERDDRFQTLGLLAYSYNRDGDQPRARQLFQQLMQHQAGTHSAATNFIAYSGAEPADLATVEKELRSALTAATQTQPDHIQYALGFNLYRDRLKDPAKARVVLREMLEQNPPNDSRAWNAVSYVLDTATSDEEFRADFDRLLAARQRSAHLNNYAQYLGNWVKQQNTALGKVRKNDPNYDEKMTLKGRVDYAASALKSAGDDPVYAAWNRFYNASGAANQGKARRGLLNPDVQKRLSPEQLKLVWSGHAYYLRHYTPAKQREECVEFYQRLAQAEPDNSQYALDFLNAATDFGPPELMDAAARHFLKLKPDRNNPDAWRRLLIAADRNENLELAKQTLAYAEASRKQFGEDPGYASTNGDVLMKFKLENEAIALWQSGITIDPDHYEAASCASRLFGRIDAEQVDEKIKFVTPLVRNVTNHHGLFTFWLAHQYVLKGDATMAERLLRGAKRRQAERPLAPWNADVWALHYLLQACRDHEQMEADAKRKVYEAIGDLEVDWPSAQAKLMLLEERTDMAPMERLLAYQRPTREVYHDATRWDQLMPFAQSAFTRQEYAEAATLVTGMLAHLTGAGDTRMQSGRDMVARCYARIGSVGLTIDETSPTAPLLQAALYLRLGDQRMAFDAYTANKALFDMHRDEMPSDLVMFVCEQHIAAGGQENYDRVEEIVRSWLIKHSESKQIEDSQKARFQLLLAKNYFSSQRFDVARSEFTTVINRYPGLPEATEAEFGVGETFMAQKVFDQAEQVFEKLANSQDPEIVVRAEFLRGVLSFRRGDHDEAREIFRNVLERAPNIDLANQTLFNLSEVFGAEERYLDQLNLLRTVGRLGRSSKRQHRPGLPLSIVVHDTDLGISRGHSRIEVIVVSQPGGDRETVYLTSGGASKGLFRVDVDTQLGEAKPGDGVLQLTGNDVVRCDYPEEFKQEFQRVPLSDVEIRVAADAKFEIASSKIIDVEKESFAERLEREAREREQADQRVSQGRPANQVKPGNLIYLRVQDPDRDLSNEEDTVVVKLAADSGDQVQFALKETGSHTGVFEGRMETAELPAGALATDMAIDHSPLMAIDKDPQSFWMSEPDGAAPKSLSIDMKDLKPVSRVKVTMADAENNRPVRGDLLGSQDGEFWFRIASHPHPDAAEPASAKFAAMQQRVFPGNFTRFTTWKEVADLGQSGQPIESGDAAELRWSKPEDDEDSTSPYGVIWHGKLPQLRAGAIRLHVRGALTAVAVDGVVELPVGPGNRSVDVWLDGGMHELTIFAAARAASDGVEATWARSDFADTQIALRPFQASDFDLAQATAQGVAEQAAQPSEEIELSVESAKVSATTEMFGVRPEFKPPYVWYWKDVKDSLQWDVNITRAGVYEVWIEQAHPVGGSTYRLSFGDQQIDAEVENTGGWAPRFRRVRIGGVFADKPGAYPLKITPLAIEGDGLMDLARVVLTPTSSTVAATSGEWQFHFDARELRYVQFRAQEYLGEALAIANVEVADNQQLHIPTEGDVLKLAQNNVLEIAGGDVVTATYTDEFTQASEAASRLLSAKLTATYFNAEVESIAYDFVRVNGAVQTIPKRLLRIEPNDRIIVQITDYDEDRTAERDTIEFEVVVNNGEPLRLTATETEEYSGIFTKEVDTSATPADGKLVVKPGDRVFCRYLDQQNTFPGHTVPRESIVQVNVPTEGLVRILDSRITPAPAGNDAPPRITYTLPGEEQELSSVAFEAPLTVEVIDPDAAKDSRSTVTVLLKTSNGAAIEVECELSSAFDSSSERRGPRGRRNFDNELALEKGRFIGQVVLQLGSKDSPSIVPLTSEMPRNLIGGAKQEDEQEMLDNLTVQVLNVSGKDLIAAGYHDEMRPNGDGQVLASRGRLIVNGQLACTDQDYDEPIEQLHVGEKLFLRVVDADQDTSDERDTVTLQIETKTGEQESIVLSETLAHSGVFTGSLQLIAAEKPTPNNLDESDPALETYFGDALTVRYLDPAASSESGELESKVELPVVIGTNGLVSAFTKVFNDEQLAIETKFHVAESYFELFKSHRNLERKDEELADLEAGRRILNEVMEDYPDPKYAPRVAYLLGQFAQELGNWQEAIQSYDLIIRRYPDHSLAPDAQYKLAQCYEEAGDFDEALEGYVTLAATYPKNPLIANVMIRISDYFYKAENFDVASQVGSKFLEKFAGHQHAPKMAFRVGQCHYKAEKYMDAGEAFDNFAKLFPDDKLASDALFWAGESYRQGRQNPLAFQRYNRCRWDFPASEAAKYARGRLALPEMLQQFEAEAANLDQ
ncbi:MAG: tetratricopeptide repeat protein [Planctomycetales bacterium]|nr:tetratricopeptide repeat protein [Planctomycetales bacterium]